MPPAPAPSTLDSSQVLPRVFDESTGKLRVDATVTANFAAPQEIIISHLDDSIQIYGQDPGAVHRVIKTSETGEVAIDGTYDAANNTNPANIGLVAQTRNAVAADSRQIEQLTAKRGTTDTTVVSLDTSLHDANGNAFSSSNRLPVNHDPANLIPEISTKLRIRTNFTNITVPAATTTIYTRSGSGRFYGFQAAYNSANVFITLTIDGVQIFDLSLVDIKTLQFVDAGNTRMQLGGFLATAGNAFDFSPKYPIPYNTTVLIESRRSDGVNHNNINYAIFLTEET